MTKRLVAYFSATGTTAKAAKILAEAASADLHEIRPAVPYCDADLNWTDRNSRSIKEILNRSARPEITGHVENMADYDEIYLGFPIWGYREPAVIDTFLEQYDFSGKTIILFATSGANGFAKTASEVRAKVSSQTIVKESRVLVGYPTTEFIDGKVVVGELSETELTEWIKSLKL